MWETRQRASLGLAAIASIVLGVGFGLLPSQVGTAQAQAGAAGGDVLFFECLEQPPDRADLAFWRAECDIAAEGSYHAGVWRPFNPRIDGGKKPVCKKAKVPLRTWVCAGVPSLNAGPPSGP
jgi:hypothetical protein